MSAPPYMKLYVADYLGDTHHLGAVEHGAYLLLLMAMWRAGGTLPAADSNLARLARCTPDQWAEIRETVLAFFRRSRGKITHKRIASEMAKYEDVSRKRSEASKQRQAKKDNENNDDNDAIADKVDINSRYNQNQNQNHSKEEEADASSGAGAAAKAKPKDRRKPETPIPEGFPDAEAMADAAKRIEAEGRIVDVEREAERFRNHAAQTDRRCRDWRAAWRNWIVGALEKAPQRAPSLFGGQPSPGAPRFPNAELRTLVLTVQGRDFVIGYLDLCAWSDDPPTITAPSTFIAERVRRDIGHRLKAMGIAIDVADQRGAAA